MDLHLLTIVSVVYVDVMVTSGTTLVTSGCWGYSGYCINLFRHSSRLDWYQGNSLCQSHSLDFLSVGSLTSQRHAQSLLPGSGANEAWIAGYRSNNTEWSTLRGDIFNFTQVTAGSGENCLYIYKPGPNSPLEYRTDNCDEQNSHHTVICHTNITHASCTDPASKRYWIQNTCFLALGVDHVTWFEAQNLCRTHPDYSGRLLDHISGDGTLSELMDNLSGDMEHPVAWLGVSREHWYWNDETVPMTFFHWAAGQGDTHETSMCTSMYYTQRWLHADCASKRTDFYFCLNYTGILTTDVPDTIAPTTDSSYHSSKMTSHKIPMTSPIFGKTSMSTLETTSTTLLEMTSSSTGTPSVTEAHTVLDITSSYNQTPNNTQAGTVPDMTSFQEPVTSDALYPPVTLPGGLTGTGNRNNIYIGVSVAGIFVVVLLIVFAVFNVRRNRMQRADEKSEVLSNSHSSLSDIFQY